MILSVYKEAIEKALSNKKYFLYFLFFSILMVFIYVFIPIFAVPGNSLQFFLAITPWWGFLIFFVLGLSVGLLITMQIYLFKSLKNKPIKETATGITATFSSVISGVFTSATCASCVSTLFSFILTPTAIITTLNYRWQISSLGFLLVLTSLFLTSRKIQNKSKICKIK